MKARGEAKVLVIGAGGLGCPALLVLARAGVGMLGIADDDVVDLTNLHRQILFSEADVGAPKLDAAKAALGRLAPSVEVALHRTRLLPENALALVSGYDLVVEGSDNFATKFLTADACAIAEVPVVHAAAVRWHGTALAVRPGSGACYRCVFEDLPQGDAPNCAEAGVVGPVCGVVAALQADLALGLLDGKDLGGELVRFDGRRSDQKGDGNGGVRRSRMPKRPGCALCGSERTIRGIERERYAAPTCDG